MFLVQVDGCCLRLETIPRTIGVRTRRDPMVGRLLGMVNLRDRAAVIAVRVRVTAAVGLLTVERAVDRHLTAAGVELLQPRPLVAPVAAEAADFTVVVVAVRRVRTVVQVVAEGTAAAEAVVEETTGIARLLS